MENSTSVSIGFKNSGISTSLEPQILKLENRYGNKSFIFFYKFKDKMWLYVKILRTMHKVTYCWCMFHCLTLWGTLLLFLTTLTFEHHL